MSSDEKKAADEFLGTLVFEKFAVGSKSESPALFSSWRI